MHWPSIKTLTSTAAAFNCRPPTHPRVLDTFAHKSAALSYRCTFQGSIFWAQCVRTTCWQLSGASKEHFQGRRSIHFRGRRTGLADHQVCVSVSSLQMSCRPHIRSQPCWAPAHLEPLTARPRCYADVSPALGKEIRKSRK